MGLHVSLSELRINYNPINYCSTVDMEWLWNVVWCLNAWSLFLTAAKRYLSGVRQWGFAKVSALVLMLSNIWDCRDGHVSPLVLSGATLKTCIAGVIFIVCPIFNTIPYWQGHTLVTVYLSFKESKKLNSINYQTRQKWASCVLLWHALFRMTELWNGYWNCNNIN